MSGRVLIRERTRVAAGVGSRRGTVRARLAGPQGPRKDGAGAPRLLAAAPRPVVWPVPGPGLRAPVGFAVVGGGCSGGTAVLSSCGYAADALKQAVALPRLRRPLVEPNAATPVRRWSR